MKKNILNKLLIGVALIAVASSCKTKQAIVARKADTTAVNTNTNANKINAIRSRQVSYNTFTGKAKAALSIDGKENNVTMNLRIQHNQKIWVSVTAIAGIEVARALITPDSILVINKLQGVYLRKPFSYVQGYSSKEMNFQTLEALLVGNAVPSLLNDNVEIQNSGTDMVLTGSLQELLYRLVVGADLKVTQTSLANSAAAQSLQVTNSNFIQADNRVMPSVIAIASTVKNKKIQLNLNYSRANFDQQLEYPFSIPGRYTPAD